jgi:TolA-binding protein
MSKKVILAVLALLVMLALLGLVFSQATDQGSADVSAQLEKVETYKWYPAQAEAIYQEITRDEPGSDYALTAHKNLVSSYLSAKRDSDAQQAIDGLYADFSSHPGLPTALYDIARIYERTREYEKANDIYQQIIQQYPDSLSADKAQLAGSRISVLSYIELKKDDAADAALNGLIADFNDNPELPESLYDIARRYERAKKYEKAASLYQQIVQQYPESSAAGRAQLAVKRTDVMLLIESGEPNAVQTAIDGLIADFTGHPALSEALFDIAGRCEKAKNYEQAKGLYQQVSQQYPDSSHAARAKVIVPKMDIFSLIESGQYSAAGAAVDKLVADFSGHSHLALALGEIARRYEKAGQYEETENVNQQIALQYSASSYGGSAEIKIPRNRIVQLIDEGQTEAAQTATDKLIADFNGDPSLADAIFVIGEQYYYKAMADANQGRADQAKANFAKTVSVWDRIRELPDSNSTAVTADAYYFSALCYRSIGEYEKTIEYFQKVIDDWPGYQYAWSAQCLIGECYEMLRDCGVIPASEAQPLIEQAYKAVIEKYPACSLVGHACLKLAEPSFRKGQWSEAAYYFEIFLREEPDDPRWLGVLYDLGTAYEKMGELGLAEETYRTFTGLADPNDPRVKTIEARAENLKEAEK